MGFFCSCDEQGCSVAVVRRFLIAEASLVGSTGSRACGLRWVQHLDSVVAVPGL